MKKQLSNLLNRWYLYRFNKKLSRLTAREEQVLDLILKCRTYAEIGAELNIGQSTVSKHASNIFKKFNCNERKNLEEIFYFKEKRERNIS
jgi:DNA-binding NarL/FixJ family response regulator